MRVRNTEELRLGVLEPNLTKGTQAKSLACGAALPQDSIEFEEWLAMPKRCAQGIVRTVHRGHTTVVAEPRYLRGIATRRRRRGKG